MQATKTQTSRRRKTEDLGGCNLRIFVCLPGQARILSTRMLLVGEDSAYLRLDTNHNARNTLLSRNHAQYMDFFINAVKSSSRAALLQAHQEAIQEAHVEVPLKTSTRGSSRATQDTNTPLGYLGAELLSFQIELGCLKLAGTLKSHAKNHGVERF